MPYTPPDYAARPDPTVGSDALHAARERAIALLTDRYADDSITEAEFEARLSWLGAANSASRIDELVADLTVPRVHVPSLANTGYSLLPVGEQRLAAIMSSTARTGQWTVPERLLVRSVMSELKLDLRYANLPPVAEFDLLSVMANVRIIVPPEMGVVADVSAIMANVRNDASEAQWPGAPRLLVTGSAIMSEVRIQVKSRSR